MESDNVTVDTPPLAATSESGAAESTLLETLQPILDAHGPSRAYFTRFFELCIDCFQPLAASIDIRIRVEVATSRYCDPSLVGKPELAEVQDQLETCATRVLVDEEADSHQITATIEDKHVHVLGVALQDVASGEVRGSLVVAVPASATSDTVSLQHELEAFCAVVMSLEQSTRPQQQPSPDPAWQRALQRSGGCGSPRELAFALVNSLCNKFQCEQVAIGIVKQKRTEILAISGLATFKANSPGVVDMRGAMDECQDRARSIVVQSLGEPDLSDDLPLHRQWSRSSGDTPVCSIPLLIDDACIGVATLRFPAERPLTRRDIKELESNVHPFAQAFQMLHLAGRSFTAHATDTLRERSRSWLRPKSVPRRLLLIAVGLSLLWFFFGFVPYKPLCTAQLVPRELRRMSAPFEAQIERVHVCAGDHVTAGQRLLEFDVHALKLDLSGLQAEIAKSEVALRQAMHDGDAGAAALARANLALLSARTAVVTDRLDKAVIVAPSDGMVIECDLHKRVGAVVVQGDPLLQFAPRSGWDVEIRVPDAVAPFVEVEQRGTFATSGRHPGQSLQFSIRQVNGTAETLDGRNVFVADAPLENNYTWMRSGMEGTAQIKTVWKPVWWVALHSVIDGLRLKFWM